MTFEISVARVLAVEAGWVNNPADPGGETNLGITWPVLREALAAEPPIVPVGTTIKTLRVVDATAIYRVFFWLKVDADQMPEIVADDALDWAVNSGISTAIRGLQTALGVAPDGNWGPVTKAAALAMRQDALVDLYVAVRLEFMAALTTWPTFGRGWARRIAQKLRDAAADLIATGAST